MDASISENLKCLDSDGYVILERVFTETFCDEIVDALNRVERDYDIRPIDQDFGGRDTVRIFNLLQYDEIFQELPVHPAYLPLAEQYLETECILSSYDSCTPWPGQGQQPLHADNWWLGGRRFPFPFMLGTILALTDFTEENGATNLVPGSHKWTEDEVTYSAADAVYQEVPGGHPDGFGTTYFPVSATAPKGSVIVYDTRLIHGAGANRGNALRPSIITTYVLGWMRQISNFTLGTPMEKMRNFSPRLQQLTGLKTYRGHFNNVNFMEPAQWLWDRPAQHQLSKG